MANQYGPWATLMNPTGNPQLSAFWRRRMTRLVPTSQSSPMLSWRNVLCLMAAGVLMLGLPTFRAAVATAEEEQPRTSADVGREPREKESKSGMISFAGTCRDSEGHPIAGAQVILFQADVMESRSQQQLQTVWTTRSGQFSFAPVADLTKKQEAWKYALPQYAPYQIFAKAAGRATVSKFVPQSSADRRRLEFHMPESATLSGKVTGPGGEPIKDALVWCSCLLPNPAPGLMSAFTDDRGRFEIRDLSPIDLTAPPIEPGPGVHTFFSAVPLHVRCAGFGDKMVMYSKVPSTVDVTLEQSAVVRGKVVYGDTGKPAVAVRVQFQGINEHAFGMTDTDSDGRYEFGSLGRDKYNIWAIKEGYTMRAIDSYAAIPGVTESVDDLRLVRGGFIAGHIIDADSGRPVYPSDSTAPPWFRPDVALYGPSRPRSGAACECSPIQQDGSYRIRVAPGINFPYLRIYDLSLAVPPGNSTVSVSEGETVNMDFKVRKKATESALPKTDISFGP